MPRRDFCYAKLDAATDCPTKDLPVSGELLWQQSRRKLLPHPGAPASAAGAIFFLEPRLLGPFWLSIQLRMASMATSRAVPIRHQQTAP